MIFTLLGSLSFTGKLTVHNLLKTWMNFSGLSARVHNSTFQLSCDLLQMFTLILQTNTVSSVGEPATTTVGLYIMRNFNSQNHGSNLQHIKHQAKTNLINSVVTGEPTKLLRRRSNCKLGNTKSKCSRHILTTCISVVLNNFMKKRLTTKSREAKNNLKKTTVEFHDTCFTLRWRVVNASQTIAPTYTYMYRAPVLSSTTAI